MKWITAIVLSLALTACAGTPTTVQNGVYASISLDYETALDLVIAYDSLPPCEVAPAPPLCSKASVVHSLKDAKDKASVSVKAMETAARTGSANVQQAINQANADVAALTTATKPLKVK